MSLELIVMLSCLGGILLVAAVIYAVRSRRALPPGPQPKEIEAKSDALPIPERSPQRDAPRAGERVVKEAPAEGDALPLPYDKPKAEPAALTPEEAAKRAERGATSRAWRARAAGSWPAWPSCSAASRGSAAQLKEEVEQVLFTADIGDEDDAQAARAGHALLDREQVADAAQVWGVIRREARAILDKPAPPLNFTPTLARTCC
jgi:fused signal recognition particle receptor